ncbi:MAG: HGGxSTG domain-containing protein [Methyloceanibacter sp.]
MSPPSISACQKKSSLRWIAKDGQSQLHERTEPGGLRANLKGQPPAPKSPRGSPLGAKTRGGTECQSPAMPNGRCRMHGGKSPGAPKGDRNAWKYGRYSGESVRLRRYVEALARLAVKTLAE